MHNLLVDLKAVSGKKINVLGKKTPIVKEAPAVAEVVADKPKEEVKAEVKETVDPVEAKVEEVVAEEASIAEVAEAPAETA